MIDGLEVLEMKQSRTERGFQIIEFRDLYDKECSIQESSIATASCIWVGQGESRMHLNRLQAFQIAQVLMRFSTEGHL